MVPTVYTATNAAAINLYYIQIIVNGADFTITVAVVRMP
jgi:hypothetical protein